jgi:hypothetical protein
MTRSVSFLLAVLSAVLAFGQEIEVPKTVPSGDLIIARAKNASAKVIFWDPRGKFLFSPGVVYRNNQTPDVIVIGGGDGEYQIALKMILEDGSALQEYASCLRGGSGPGPGTPPPGPGPVLNDLGKISRDAARNLPASAKANIGKVVTVYREVIARAVAQDPAYSTIKDIQANLQAARAAAQGDVASWNVWSNAIKTEWDRMWEDSGGQVTRDNVLTFNRSVLAGLEAALASPTVTPAVPASNRADFRSLDEKLKKLTQITDEIERNRRK